MEHRKDWETGLVDFVPEAIQGLKHVGPRTLSLGIS